MKEYTPGELMQQLSVKNFELTKLNIELSTTGSAKDKFEREYKRELSIRLLQLRQERVPIAIINDVAKGDIKISNLRYQRDNARSNFSVLLSAIANKRVEIETIRSKLSWMRVEFSQKD